MAEASSNEDKPAKKPAKKKATPAVPSAPPSAGWVADWRTWALLGGALVFGVVAWKLLGTSYKRDVETVCDGEPASGYTMEKDGSKVTAYVRQHLGTPEGNEFYATLTDSKLVDRAKRLRSESSGLGIGSCPAVAAYERLAAEGDYRGDIQHLCSNAAFSHIGEADDDARLKRLEDWIDQGAKSPRTKELAEPLRKGTPADRAKLLRDTANKLDIFSCDLAKTLEGPVLPAKGTGTPTVRPYAEPQIIGVLKAEDLAKAVVDVTPAMNECYKKGLEKKPDLEGKLAVKMKVDPSGKVTSAAPADQTLPDPGTAMCIIQAMKGMELPKNPGPLVSIFIPLELTTQALPTAGAPGAAPAPSGMPAFPSLPGMPGIPFPGLQGAQAGSGRPMVPPVPLSNPRPPGSTGH